MDNVALVPFNCTLHLLICQFFLMFKYYYWYKLNLTWYTNYSLLLDKLNTTLPIEHCEIIYCRLYGNTSCTITKHHDIGALSRGVWKSQNPEILGVQGWRSGESTHPSAMWPGFDFRTLHHMWVAFVGSPL